MEVVEEVVVQVQEEVEEECERGTGACCARSLSRSILERGKKLERTFVVRDI